MYGLESFGSWVKVNRRALGLTQEEFARMVYCASITLRKIESNKLRPSRDLAYSIVDKAGASPEERELLVRWARQRDASLFRHAMGQFAPA